MDAGWDGVGMALEDEGRCCWEGVVDDRAGPLTLFWVGTGLPDTVCLRVIGDGVLIAGSFEGVDVCFSVSITSLRLTLAPLDAICHGEAGVFEAKGLTATSGFGGNVAAIVSCIVCCVCSCLLRSFWDILVGKFSFEPSF